MQYAGCLAQYTFLQVPRGTFPLVSLKQDWHTSSSLSQIGSAADDLVAVFGPHTKEVFALLTQV